MNIRSKKRETGNGAKTGVASSEIATGSRGEHQDGAKQNGTVRSFFNSLFGKWTGKKAEIAEVDDSIRIKRE